jgi:hypothetical protein
MIWLVTTPIGRALSGAVAVLALIGAVWWHGGKSARDEAAARAANDRLQHITDTRDKRDAAENLDDDGLINALGRWLLP